MLSKCVLRDREMARIFHRECKIHAAACKIYGRLPRLAPLRGIPDPLVPPEKYLDPSAKAEWASVAMLSAAAIALFIYGMAAIFSNTWNGSEPAKREIPTPAPLWGYWHTGAEAIRKRRQPNGGTTAPQRESALRENFQRQFTGKTAAIKLPQIRAGVIPAGQNPPQSPKRALRICADAPAKALSPPIPRERAPMPAPQPENPALPVRIRRRKQTCGFSGRSGMRKP